jgi:thiamine kinase-like enzyme
MQTLQSTETIGRDDAAACRTVEGLLSAARGRPTAVSSLRRRPSPFATLAPADLLTALLADGSTVSLFVKRCGSEQADHPDRQRPADREARVYGQLLRDAGLPVVRCYGTRPSPHDGRSDLFLEFLDDWNLRYHDLEHWITAARRLAHLHAHFAIRVARLLTCDFLLRFDADYFRAWAERALSTVTDCSTALGARLDAVVSGNVPVAEWLARAPVTLVHNDLSPKNVLADRSIDPARIAIVDWELAGVGCGLLDLAHLAYGLGADAERRMCEAYCDEWRGLARLPCDPSDFERLLAACQLQKVLYRLARWKAWRVTAAQVAGWVGEAEQLRARI